MLRKFFNSYCLFDYDRLEYLQGFSGRTKNPSMATNFVLVPFKRIVAFILSAITGRTLRFRKFWMPTVYIDASIGVGLARNKKE